MNVWVVMWGAYVHAVCASEEEAEEYCSRRWPRESAYGVHITEWTVGTGWNPQAESRTPLEEVE